MANRERKNLTLSQETLGLLAQVGNASEYVERIVLEHWRTWQTALRKLVDDGMTTGEILACCDVLNGYYSLVTFGDTGAGHASSIAIELHDGQALNKTAQKHSCDLNRWRELVLRVRASQLLADAIQAVAQEFWSGNEACEAAINRVDKIRDLGDINPVLGPGFEAKS